MSKNNLARQLQNLERTVANLEVSYFEEGGYSLPELQLLVENTWFASAHRRLRSFADVVSTSAPID